METITGVAYILACLYGILTVIRLIEEIIAYNRPEYFCAKCGARVSKKAKICHKCKELLTEE